MPPIEEYINENDSSFDIERKKQFVKKMVDEDYIFNFALESVFYCEQDCIVLAHACILFLSQCFQFQNILKSRYPNHLKPTRNQEGFFHPFVDFSTLSSFAFAVFRAYALPENTLYTIMVGS